MLSAYDITGLCILRTDPLRTTYRPPRLPLNTANLKRGCSPSNVPHSYCSWYVQMRNARCWWWLQLRNYKMICHGHTHNNIVQSFIGEREFRKIENDYQWNIYWTSASIQIKGIRADNGQSPTVNHDLL